MVSANCKMAENVESDYKGEIAEQPSDEIEYPTVVQVFFTVEKDDGNFIDAICNLCKPLKNVIRGQFKTPSNFTKHIKVNNAKYVYALNIN
jgi:hypothetical protein